MPKASLLIAVPVLVLGMLVLSRPVAVADQPADSAPACRFTLERRAPDSKAGTEVWVLTCHRLAAGRASVGEVRRVNGEAVRQTADGAGL
ncbi:MAG TPA: hypothetical protein VM689_19345 [Aliidongia sp.]|nr:hypothetical protein [Aliidongia sp.]